MSSINVHVKLAATAVKSVATQPDLMDKNDLAKSTVTNPKDKQSSETAAGNQPTEKELNHITNELNQFMQSINTAIQFKLHSDTHTLMVEVVDSQTNKILKEVPAHELLDMVSKMKDCIGVFLDEKM